MGILLVHGHANAETDWYVQQNLARRRSAKSGRDAVGWERDHRKDAGCHGSPSIRIFVARPTSAKESAAIVGNHRRSREKSESWITQSINAA